MVVELRDAATYRDIHQSSGFVSEHCFLWERRKVGRKSHFFTDFLQNARLKFHDLKEGAHDDRLLVLDQVAEADCRGFMLSCVNTQLTAASPYYDYSVMCDSPHFSSARRFSTGNIEL